MALYLLYHYLRRFHADAAAMLMPFFFAGFRFLS